MEEDPRPHLHTSHYTLPYSLPYTRAEEVAHTLTHGVGLLLSLVVFVALVVAASEHGDGLHVVGCAVFGATLVLLYAASTLYHATPAPGAKRLFQKFDHAAIFLLIAGTYTPFTLVPLRGSWGWTLLALVWGAAIVGISLQIAIPRAARRASVPLYLGMGWLVVIAASPLVRALEPEGIALLVLGGLAYTLGVVFYAWRRLPYNHAVWHLFVLGGSACHVTCVLGYVVPPS
jgi:hemolysin III